MKEDWYGKQLTISVCGVNESATGTAATIQKTYGAPLPSPKCHLELGGYTSKKKSDSQSFVLVLDNYEEYLEFFDTYSVSEADQKNITISTIYNKNTKTELKITLDPSNIRTYTDADGKKAYYVASSNYAALEYPSKSTDTNKSNEILTFTAKAANEAIATTSYRESGSTMHWAKGTSGYSLTGVQMIEWGDMYFSGTYSDELEIKIDAYQTFGESDTMFDIYYQTDVLSDQITSEGNTLIDAAVSSNLSHIDYSSLSKKPVAITLSNLPENILQNSTGTLTVQGYDAITQVYISYAGHDVATGITEAKLLTLKDYLRLNSSGQWGAPVVTYDSKTKTIKANDGYVIYMNTDGAGNVTYDVKFNSILQNEDIYGISVQRAVMNVNAGTEAQNQITINNQNIGVTKNISIQYVPVLSDTMTVEDNTYTVSWTCNAASYEVSLYGLTKDSDGNVIAKTLLSTGETTETSYTFTDDSMSWNFDAYVYRVMSLGTEAGGETTVLPYYADSEEIVLKKRYTRLSAPIVSVPSDPGNMDYRISWNPISEADDSTAAADFATYEVTIEDADGNLPTVYYYTTADGILPSGIQLPSGETYEYTHRLTEDELGSIMKTYEMGDPNVTSVCPSMDGFAGCTLNISVKALAKKDAEVYSESLDGNVRTIEITSRLKTPDVTKMTAVTGATDGVVKAADLSENGIDLAYSDSDASAEGRYQLRLFLYDGDTKLSEVEMSMLASDTMNGNLRQGTFNIPNELTDTEGNKINLTDYAGKSIYVALRATSENAISSYWTDEDENADSYFTVTIPNIKKNAPTIASDTRNIEYRVHGVDDANEDIVIDNLVLKPSQKDVSFDYENADGYSIYLVRDLGKNSDGEVQRTAYHLQIRKNDSGYQVLWSGADDGSEEALELTAADTYDFVKETSDITEASFEGLSGTIYKLPYSVEIGEDNIAAYTRAYSNITSWLVIDESGEIPVVHLILPDNDTTDSSGLVISGTWTSGITVQAVAEDEHYESSDGSHISGSSTDVSAFGEGITTVITAEKTETEGVTLRSLLHAAVSGYDGNLRLLFEITRDGKKRIYSLESKDSAGTVNVLDLSGTELKEYADTDRIRIAYINVSDNTVSDWISYTEPVETEE